MIAQELPKISELVYRLLVLENELVKSGKKVWSDHLGLHSNTEKLIDEVHKILPLAPMESITRVKRKLYSTGSWMPQDENVLREYLKVRIKNESEYREFFSHKTEKIINSDELELIA